MFLCFPIYLYTVDLQYLSRLRASNSIWSASLSSLVSRRLCTKSIALIYIYIYSILMHKTSCVRTEAASTCYGGSMRAFPSQVHIGMNTQDSRDEGCSITQRQLFSVDAHSGVLFTVLYCFLDEVGDPPIANSRGLGSFWR